MTAMPSAAAQPMHSSPEDPFEHDSLCSLMPNLFKGLIKQDSVDPFKTQTLHLALRQEVLKKTSKVTEQANAILSSTGRSDTAENHSGITLYNKPKNQQSEDMEEIAQLPALTKENLPPNKICPKQQISMEGSGHVSTQPPFDISSISFRSSTNLQRDPKTLEGSDEFHAAAELQSKNSETMKKIAQLPALSKENLPPKENCPNRRIRREGSGRISNRRPFNIISTSSGSNLNSQRDPSNMENVEEFFAAFERQEAAERIMRKWRGEKSPVCSQSLKTRVRRQGTGRKTMPRKYDVKLLGDTEKIMELDEEKLEIEEEECPVSTFTGSEGQACELKTEVGNREINNGVSLIESGNKESLPETAINELQSQKDVQLDSNLRNAMHTHDQHIMGHCADDLQLNPFQGKGIISTFETEETVNMPPKNLLSSFDNSTGSALERLLNEYMKSDSENIQKGPFTRSGLGNYEIGKPPPKDAQLDTLNTLPQSQTESSNTFNSQSLIVDEVRTLLQGQLPKGFAGSDRTPPQMLTKTSSPLTSPTPPSRISYAFGSRRKGSNGDKGASEDASKPSFKNRDEEAPKEKTKWQLGHSPKEFAGSDRMPPEDFRQKQTKYVSSSMSPNLSSRPSAALGSSKKCRSGVKGTSVDACKPSSVDKDEEAPKDATSNPSKQVGSSGVRRLSFGGASQSPDLAEVNSKEGVNDVTAMDLMNYRSPSKQFGEDDKVEMVRGDVDFSNESVLIPERSTPVSSSGPTNCNAVGSGHATNDVPGSALGEQVEESPVAFHKRNAKKIKRQYKNNATTSNCDVHEGDQIVPKGIEDNRKNKKKSEYQRRQSLAGAGTLWKSGVRRSTRIKSRPLEYWRGERFLYGRIHSSLATVIGIKYSSPLPERSKKDQVPKLKVQSFVDEQYSHLVEFAALH